MLIDPVFTIRETALQSMIEISKTTMSSEWLLKIMLAKISELSKNERFMIRIQAIHFINRMAPEVTKEVLSKQFAEVLISLADDPVPNIRFNVSKSIESLYHKLSAGGKFKVEGSIKKMCGDADFDCQYFARKCMERIQM